MSTLKAKTIMSVLFTLAVVVGSGIFAFSTLTTDVDLSITTVDEGLRISHSGKTLLPREDFQIDFDQVEEVLLMEVLPEMRRTNGLGNSVVQIGAFQSEALGEFRAYVWAKKSPHLFIRTSAGAYLVTPDNALAIYERLALGD